MGASARRIMVWLGGATVALGAVGVGSSSSAMSDEVTLAPHVPTTTELHLLGRTSNGGPAVIRNGGAVLTGGPELGSHGVSVDEPGPDSGYVHDLTGNVLRWAEPRSRGSRSVIHEVDVTGGRTTTMGSPDRVVALTGDGWLGWDMGRTALVAHVPGAPDRTLLTGVYDPQAVADERGAAVTYYRRGGAPRLVLIDFASGRVETLTDYRDVAHPALNQQWPDRVTLTPRDVVWSGWNGMPLRAPWPEFHRRARSGGPVATVKSPRVYNFTGPVAATDDRIVVAYIAKLGFGPGYGLRLWSLDDGAWHPIPVPNQDDDAVTPDFSDFGGFSVDGADITLALGGDLSTQAGVYAVGSGALTRIATVPTGADTVPDVSLNAGRLTYSERAVGAPADRPLPIWQAEVKAGPTLGPEQEIGETRHVRGGTRPALSVAGGRLTVLGSWFFPWQGVTYSPGELQYLPALATVDRPIRSSGRYVLADDKVFGVPGDGEPLLDLTGQKCRGTDLFGPVAVCSRPDGRVLVWNLTRARSLTNPAVIRDRADGDVAVWGTGVAWHRDDDSIAYQAARGEPIRLVAAAGPVEGLRLSEGTLSWQDGSRRIMLLDVEDPASTPAASGLTAPGMVDDHQVAGLGPGGRLTVRTLPFGTVHPPRLISWAVPRSFRPPAQRWAPEFEVSKAVTDVRLTVRRGSRVVAVLGGTGEAGDVRGLSWDGRSLSHPVTPGAYTWRLTASAKDGEGPLPAVTGRLTVH